MVNLPSPRITAVKAPGSWMLNTTIGSLFSRARLIAAVEISKVGNGAPYHIADFSPAITLVAEPALADEDLAAIQAAGAEIVRLEQEVSK